MKLPKSIIAKYGISKKAWSIFKGKTKAKTQVKTMARRGRIRRYARRTFGRSKRSSGDSGLLGLITAGLWGAGRNKISQMAAPLYNKLPLGKYNDEAFFAGLAMITPMVVKSQKVKKIANTIRNIEIFNAAGAATSGYTGSVMTNGSGGMIYY